MPIQLPVQDTPLDRIRAKVLVALTGSAGAVALYAFGTGR